MRFVAGQGAVAERLQRGGAVAELLAGALRQSCWQGRCSRAAGRGAAAELLAGSAMAKRMAGAPW